MGCGRLAPLIVIELAPSPNCGSWRGLKRSGCHSKLRKCAATACLCHRAKAADIEAEAAQLETSPQHGALMISIAAGTTRAFVRAWGKGGANRARHAQHSWSLSARAFPRFMPRRTCAQQIVKWQKRCCPTGRDPLGEAGITIDSVTAVSGSGPAYVFLLAEALAEAARTEGLRDSGGTAGSRHCRGRRRAVEGRTFHHCTAEDVTSPGGTTEAALRCCWQRTA